MMDPELAKFGPQAEPAEPVGAPAWCPSCKRVRGSWAFECRYSIALCMECETRLRAEAGAFGSS